LQVQRGKSKKITKSAVGSAALFVQNFGEVFSINLDGIQQLLRARSWERYRFFLLDKTV
jgi:hypothetical protein